MSESVKLPAVCRSQRGRWIVSAVAVVIAGVLTIDLACRPTGPLVPPPAGAEPGRWVYLEGAANTRDIGGYHTRDGYAVRRGRVFRSGTLSNLSSAGVRTFRDLGVTTVLDFRNRLSPLPWFHGDPLGVQWTARVHGCPMSFAGPSADVDFYVRGIRDNPESFRQAFEVLSQTDQPVLFHCAAGVDRTGVMAALLLTLLGVPRDTVLEDFRLSEQIDRGGNRPALVRLLDEIEHAGGIEPYLLNLGVGRECQERIQQALSKRAP